MMIAQMTSKGQLVIPSKLRRKYFIGTGTKVVLDEENGKITIQPVTEAFVNSICGMLKVKEGSATYDLLKEHKAELAKGK